MKLFQYLSFIFLFAVISCSDKSNTSSPEANGDNLAPLHLIDSGRSSEVEWQLYLVSTDQGEADMILVIKNIGAKHIDLEDVTSKHFSVRADKDALIQRVSKVNGLAFGEIGVTHLHIAGLHNTKEYVFRLSPLDGAFVPVSITSKSLKLELP